MKLEFLTLDGLKGHFRVSFTTNEEEMSIFERGNHCYWTLKG